MGVELPSQLRDGYCVFINTLFRGPVPAVHSEVGYAVFETELEAQKEIADNAMTRLQEFMDGERDFDDAITVEEYVVRVSVQPNGTVIDEVGRRFDPKDR